MTLFSDNPGLERMMQQKPAGRQVSEERPAPAPDSPCYDQHHKLKEKMERNLFAGSFHCVKI